MLPNPYTGSTFAPASGSGGSAARPRTVAPPRYITAINRNDVVLGRGTSANDNPGNVAFRNLVSSRRSDYLAATTRRDKQLVAQDVMDRVRYGVTPPGRFLQRVEGPAPPYLWCEVTEVMALEKVKRALRRMEKDEECPPRPDRGAESSCHIPGADGAAKSPSDASRGASPASDAGGGAPTPPPCGNGGATSAAGGPGVAGLVTQAGEGSGGGDRTAREERARALGSSEDRARTRQDERTASRSSGPKGSIPVRDERTCLLESVRAASDLVDAANRTIAGMGGFDTSSPSGDDQSSTSVGDHLVLLGSKLYRHFAGVDPFDSSPADDGSASWPSGVIAAAKAASPLIESSQLKKKKEWRSTTAAANANSQKYVPLQDLGLPVSLCLLVSSLLDAQDEGAVDRYRTPWEVEKDLVLMLADPERYLFDAGAERLGGQLKFPAGRLYGREGDVSRLMAVFCRAFDHVGTTAGPRHPSEMILISGYSGMGKTVLVDQLRLPLAERNGHFISGKFDELGQAPPMSIIFTALDDFCANLLACDEGQISQMREAINVALGPGVHVLTGLIPKLSTVLEVNAIPFPSTFDIGGKEALNRLVFHLRLFLRAISSPSHPSILFLDDLQWADKATLELITMLVSDAESRPLLFVGCYRDNEVGTDHPLKEATETIAFAGVNVTSVELDNINRDSVNALVSDALHLSPRLSQSLANVVYAKTSGNPLFVVQFLRSLCDENLLKYSASSRRWEWDVEAIQSKDIAHNVVDLMKRKMLRLDPAVQKLLKEASCLGTRFEASTLQLLLSSDGDGNVSDIERVISLPVDEGLLYRVGSSYKFSHDQIMEAAYSLIPLSKQEAMHLHIGRLLWRRVPQDELESVIFIIVDQLYRGANLISDHAEKVQMAGLCLMAGKMAMSSSAFLQASIYLLQGTALLNESDWEDNYDLSLQVFTCCAEALYATCNFDGVVITTNPILRHGRSLQDKLCAYYTLLDSLGSLGKPFDALDIGLKVVAQLGESFPKEIHLNDVVEDFTKTRGMLPVMEGSGKDVMLPANLMEDAEMVGVMKILGILGRITYEVDQQLMALIFCRIVQLSLRHGICKDSAFGFASVGGICCSFGDYRQGYKNGKLALSLLDRFEGSTHMPRVYIVVYGLIFIYTEPAQASLPPLKDAYRKGMEMGDIDYAMYNASTYVLTALQCGSKLETLAGEARAFTQQMKEHKHNMLYFMQPCFQTILNLMSCAGDPITLTGEVMDQDELLNRALEEQQRLVVYRLGFFRMWLAYLFRRYDVAEETAKQCQKNCELVPFRLETEFNDSFYLGLIAAALARKGKAEWRSIAFEAAEKMKTWAGNSSWNFDHKLHLLQAENAYLSGDFGFATKAYDDAIRLAGEHGFLHEQALACERAGIFHSEAVNADVGTEYFKRSHRLYVEWGAQSKADNLLMSLGGKWT